MNNMQLLGKRQSQFTQPDQQKVFLSGNCLMFNPYQKRPHRDAERWQIKVVFLAPKKQYLGNKHAIVSVRYLSENTTLDFSDEY